MPDLFQAVRLNGSGAAQDLSAATDLNVREPDGMNLLHAAIAHRNHAVLPLLLDRGVDVNAQDCKGQTPLHYACAHRDLHGAEALVAGGADISRVDVNGNTPLWTAVFNARGENALVELLMAAGGEAYATLRNRSGRSPLDFASQIGDEPLVTILKGA